MAAVGCVDGSVLEVVPVPVRDRDGTPYELTLGLARDGQPFGAVGERCGWFLASIAARLNAALVPGSPEAQRWPSVDDRFPVSSVEGGLSAWAADKGLEPATTWASLQRYLPRDRELFSFRHRDPDDVASTGELRCSLHTTRAWEGDAAGTGGRWRLTCRAALDAWGSSGSGIRAVLTAPELAAFLAALLGEAEALGCAYDADAIGAVVVRRPAG